MTGGIGVPGFIGYELGVPLPTLTQILNGAPPANSPPVTVIGVPGSAYQYSGGGYEIMEALIVDTLHAPFPEAMDALVLKPAEMAHSTFAQPLPPELAGDAARGHHGDGKELPGGFRVCPEHAAAGLWSTPSDLANLLLLVGRAWRGESRLFLAPEDEPGDANPAKWRSLWARSDHPRHCRHPGPHETWTECWLPRLPHPASDRRSGTGGDDQLR
jgi:CubicO group peptidase (beta-lactamase class C family)